MRPYVHNARLLFVRVEQRKSRSWFKRDRFRHAAGEFESASGRHTVVVFELGRSFTQPSRWLLLKTAAGHRHARMFSVACNRDHSLSGGKAPATRRNRGSERTFRQIRRGDVRRDQDMSGVLSYELPVMKCRLADGAAGASEEGKYERSVHGLMILVSATSLY